jgi:flagellar basal-body rod protein FlgF
MSRGLYVALSGAVAQEHALEATATNLANATTPGYQRLRPVFREVLAGATRDALHFAQVAQTAVDTTRGAVRSTGRDLDIALADGQYLAVATPAGERYTRAGSLTMSADGALKTTSGASLVKADGSPIRLVPSDGPPVITQEGNIVQGASVTAKLKIVSVPEGTTMSHEAGGLLAAGGPVSVVGDARVDVGALEESNATTVTAMTELVTATRTFEAFQRMLDTFGDCDRKVLTTTSAATE